jgi:hypothetical protein
MGKADLIEDLAAIEHQRWSDWQRYVQDDCCIVMGSIEGFGMHNRETGEYIPFSGQLLIAPEKRQHWERLIATPYADLPEHSKQADRDQVARYWPLLVAMVAQWIEHQGQVEREILPIEASSLARKWTEEMA